MKDLIRSTSRLTCVLFAFFFTTSLLITACGDNSTGTDENPERTFTEIEVTPTDHSIDTGGTKKFNAYAVTSTGERIPFSELDKEKWVWFWFTKDPNIATFDHAGLATGHNIGNTKCYILLAQDDDATKSSLKDLIALQETNPKLSKKRIIPITVDCFGVQVVQDRLGAFRKTYDLQPIR
jgi:hypothetical protein